MFSGNNSGFSGGVTLINNPLVVWQGANSSGTGTLTYTTQYAGYGLHLLNDTSAAFLASNISYPNFDGNTGGSINIDVDPLTSGTGQTLTLNKMTLTSLGNNMIPPLNVTSSNGYTLAVGTLNLPGSAGTVPFTLNPTSGSLQIGTLNANSITLTFGGTATGNSVGTINSSNATGLHVIGGTWRVTGTANMYAGATAIDGTSSILNIAALAAGGAASSIGNSAATAGNLVFGGGTLQYTATTGATTTNRLFTIGDGTANTATLDSSSPTVGDTMSFTATGSIAFTNTAAHTLALTGSNTGANSFAPSSPTSRWATRRASSRLAAGTWILTNANSYAGGTAPSTPARFALPTPAARPPAWATSASAALAPAAPRRSPAPARSMAALPFQGAAWES